MRVEELRPGFTAYHFAEPHWPWQPRLHRIWTPEPLPHDHPGDMTITIVKGEGYDEEVFARTRRGLVFAYLAHRKLGDRFEIKAEHIHRIVQIYGDEVWSFVEPAPHRREWRLYDLPKEHT